MHLFDLKTKKDLIDFVKDDFYTPEKHTPPQIGGKSLPQSYVWGTFKLADGYVCKCFRKDSDEEVILSSGKSYEEMFDNFIEVTSKRFQLAE